MPTNHLVLLDSAAYWTEEAKLGEGSLRQTLHALSNKWVLEAKDVKFLQTHLDYSRREWVHSITWILEWLKR